MIKRYKIKCNLFWNQKNYFENDELEIDESIAKKYPYFFEEINEINDSNNDTMKSKIINTKKIKNKKVKK